MSFKQIICDLDSARKFADSLESLGNLLGEKKTLSDFEFATLQSFLNQYGISVKRNSARTCDDYDTK